MYCLILLIPFMLSLNILKYIMNWSQMSYICKISRKHQWTVLPRAGHEPITIFEVYHGVKKSQCENHKNI